MTILPSARHGERTRGLLIGAIGLAISVAALWLIVGSVDIAAAGEALANANLAYLLPALGILVIGVVLRIIRWQHLLPPLPNGQMISQVRIAPVLFIGYMGNAILPARLGEAVRAYLISRREAVPFSGALGSVVLERIIDTATLAVLAFAAAVGVGAAPWVVQGTGIIALVGVSVVVVLATIGLGPFVPLVRWVLVRVPERLHAMSLMPAIERFVEFSGGSHRRPVVIFAAVLSLGAWLCDAAMIWFVGQALGIHLAPAEAVLISAITVLSTAIPSAPGYVGTYELAAVSVATALGVASGPALALAVLAHSLAIVPSALAGAVALALLGGGWRSLSKAAVAQRAQQAQQVTGQ